MSAELETYLSRLEHELGRRGLDDSRILEEARGHLADATEAGIRRGLAPDAAAREAIARFGSPEAVARNFAAERHRLRDRLLLWAAVAIGVAIAYVDSRPHWDDAGIVACAMLIAAAVLGLIGPQRPWRWALAVGIWIPLYALARTGSPGALAMFIVLAFPAVGAYSGMALRRVLTPAGPSRVHFVLRQHDRARRFALHSLVKARKHSVPPSVSEPEARAQVVPFLERAVLDSAAPAAWAAVQSLTLLEEAISAGKHVRRYRVLFETGATATVVHASDDRSVSIDASPESET